MQAKYLLLFRAVLLEVLLLQALYSPDVRAEHGWLWGCFGLYLLWAFLVQWLTKKNWISPSEVQWTFAIDIVLTSATLYLTRGYSQDFYIAYFLVILSSCFVDDMRFSFLIGSVACFVYGALAFPGWDLGLQPQYLLRLSFLLVTAFFTSYIVEHTRFVEKQTEGRFQDTIAWMQRLTMVGKAVASILHEVKTPLSTVVLTVDHARGLMKKGADIQEDLTTISEEADRACLILEEYLSFAKPQPLTLVPVRIDRLIGHVLEAQKARLEQCKIEIRRELGAHTVLGNEARLVQIFTNLVINAIEAMPMGGTLHSRAVRKGNQVTATLSDNGTGIAPEVLAKLGEPFMSTKSAGAGHGLGLTVVRSIVHQHQGEFQIRSDGLGRGAIATVILPSASVG